MSTTPVSSVFGVDRGTPIDRYYIEQFLTENQNLIQGKVLEIAESTYSRKFGKNVSSYEILHVDSSNSAATIIGDLTNPDTLPEGAVDCFICTQTLNFIYDFRQAIKGIHKVLNTNGVALVTLAGISQISRYDMDRWGDYWRFTELSATESFAEVFKRDNIQTNFYGNVFSAVCFLEGISVEEIDIKKLDQRDNNYQMLITLIVRK